MTTSVTTRVDDFEINARGTLNVLEAARRHGQRRRSYTSTNKVYGGMDDVPVVELPPATLTLTSPRAPARQQPLDFHSPYGCSKGAADQYVRDYARIYGLRTVVFRMSCIYGPRQFGNEDQGWVAHFLDRGGAGPPDHDLRRRQAGARPALRGRPGARLRAGLGAASTLTAGHVYNIGGGAANTLAIWTEFGPLIERAIGAPGAGDLRALAARATSACT